MNTYIWCAVGLIAGGIVAAIGSDKDKVHIIETIAIGIFGAVIGGDLVGPMLTGGAPAAAAAAGTFRVSSLAYAIGGTVAMLFLLSMMRRSVGPMRPHKERSQKR
jgi:uncharacterized membrane protein YeaQ/YmgE (transglycosylase-associated protein family)